MIVTFDQDPCEWVHPFYRRQRPIQPFQGSWNDLVGPALDTVSTLSQILQLAQSEPRATQSIRASQREQQNRDKFEVKLNVQQFAPDELDVKLVDNSIVVQGKHEEKQDEHGFISRQFVRRYQLPDDVKPEELACNISSDGVLCLTAPRAVEKKEAIGRSIPIVSTGQPALQKVTENEKNEDGGKRDGE